MVMHLLDQWSAFFVLEGLSVEWTLADQKSKKMAIPYETYQKGCILDIKEGIQAAQRIGFPVMIKASEGGGGKGIRKSNSVEDFPNLFRQVIVLIVGM